MYQATMLGSCQYQLAQGAAAATWLTAYVAAHGPLGSGEIPGHDNDGHNLTTLTPPHEEGCLTQLDLEYHFETENQAAYSALFDEVMASIYYGTAAPFSEAACDSTFQ